MEWIFILIGIAYSIYSSIKKEAKAREEKLRQTGKPTARRTADQMFAQSSGRRTLGGTHGHTLSSDRPTRDINAVQPASTYGTDVSTVQEVSIEDMQEDFTTRLNRKLMERGAQPSLRRSISEVFGDLTVSENQRTVDYDQLATYDDRSRGFDDRINYDDSFPKYAAEHDTRSHFKLNEGLHSERFRAARSNAFEELDLEEEAERKLVRKSSITLDPESLKRYFIMHEVLGKPRAMQPRRVR
jgi:hypothetical protein